MPRRIRTVARWWTPIDEESTFGFCTEYLLRDVDLPVARSKRAWKRLANR